MAPDPLAISRGLALSDAALAVAGLDREARLRIWRASQDAMAAEEAELGLGGWLYPGVQLWVESRREGLLRCELGWPEISAGPSMMRWALRRFGSMAWDPDGGHWAPGWWASVRGPVGVGAWDRREDERQIAEEIARGTAEVWRRGQWLALGWRFAAPGWADRIFCANHEAMKRGIRAAMAGKTESVDIHHLPVLAGGSRLVKATGPILDDPKTTLFSPSEAGYRAFLENVRSQGVSTSHAKSMAFTWWGRHLDGPVLP